MSTSSLVEQIGSASQSTLDISHALLKNVLDSTEQLNALTVAFARNALAEQVDVGKKLLAARTLPELFAAPGASIQPQFEHFIDFVRGSQEIVGNARSELLQLLESRHGALNQSLTAALEQYGKSSGNSEIALAAVKSAISAANSAFANTSRAVRQVANLADSGLSAATSSALRSSGSASQTRKKAA